MMRRTREIDNHTVGLVARQGLFAEIAADKLHALLEGCELLKLEGGDVLLTIGQLNRSLYVLLSGRLEVQIDRADSGDGFRIAPGECVGEISMIDGKPTTARVFAARPSRVLSIPEAILWRELLAHPGFAKSFMRLFAARFRARNEVMRQALEQQLRYQHLQKELAIARDIQCGMLPRHLAFTSELEIAAEMWPARHVGGDFFDVFPVNQEKVCVAIGDIAGKGVPAALFVVRTMTLLRAELLKGEALDVALSNLNRVLCEENPTHMFATLVLGMFHVRTGRFLYSNAGHDAIALGDGGLAYRWLPRPRGILAGVDENASYEVADLGLHAGDTLLFYTDGITEAMNGRRELFTSNRLLACLERAPSPSPQVLVEHIQHEVQRFVGDATQSDDCTLLIVRYRGRRQPD